MKDNEYKEVETSKKRYKTLFIQVEKKANYLPHVIVSHD